MARSLCITHIYGKVGVRAAFFKIEEIGIAVFGLFENEIKIDLYI